jgi:GNAT superfamily N-acetyltransferase
VLALPPLLVDTVPDDERFAAWCGVWAASQLADRPDEAPRPDGDHVALARQLLAPGGSRDGTHRAALVDGAVVGALRLLLPTQDNPAVAVVDVAVHPDHRRRGIGTSLLDQGVRLAAQHGRTELISEVDEPHPATAGRAFALRHGWSCDLLETRRDLDLPPDEDRLVALEVRARAASRGYELVCWRDWTPDELMDDRALLEQRMSTDAPHGDLPVDEERWDADRIREYEASHVARGRTVLSSGAVKDGRLVAFTDLQIPLAQPERAQQGGTLVLREHRGRRLG